MAILNHGSTIRTADGGQSTTTIVTASNIGTYGVAANSTYYIGTTQNVFNRASGAQTLTGVSIDGNAANITAYTINQNVGSSNSPTFATLQLTRLNFGATGTTPYAAASGEGIGNGITFGGDEAGNGYRIFTAIENIGGNYSKLTFNWHTGIRIGAAYQYGGTRFYNNSVGVGTEIFSVGNLDNNVRVINTIYAQSFYDINNTSYYLDAANSGTSLLVAGNVGIGTTSPVSKLHVVGEGDTVTLQKSNNVPALAFLGTSTNKSVIEGGDNFNFYTGGSSRFYIKNDGNVGIGTTSPGSKLQINNASDSRLIIYETGTAPYTATLELSSQVLGTYGATIQYTSDAEKLTIQNYGRSSASSVQGGILFRTKLNNTTATDVMVINGFSGNVGIGTTSPSQKLHVVGTGFASSDFRAPIFYDSDNTTYYLDPNASTSGNLFGVLKQNDGKFVRDSYFRTISGVGDYYASGASGWYTVASITLTTNCTGGVLYGTLYDNRYDGADTYQIAIVARAECDFTTNNESHYVNVGCTILGSTNIINYQSKIRVLLVASSTNSRTYEVQFLETAWNRDTWQLETGGSPVWTIYSTAQAPGTSTGTARVFYISNKNADNIRANTASYSPIYYDSSDTSYYSDPAGLNRFNALNIGNQGALTGNTTYALGAYHNSRYMVGLRYSSGGAAYPWLVHDSWNGSAFIIHFNGVGDRFHVSESGIAYVTGDFRAPIFYDSNNTSYYLDPASTSNLVGLTVANTITGSISGNAATATTLQTARTINGTSFNGSANITTSSWGTARTLTIGSTGKSVDGSAAVSWSLAEIGALPLSGGQITGNTTFSADNHLTFGPNSTWGSSIRIGGNGYTATGTETASVVTTDGNLHLDAAKSTNGIYLNWYGGTSGVFFGNGSSGQVAFVSNTGNASFSGVVDATQFRDASNTAFYLDPASTSRLNIVHSNYYIGEITDSGNGDSNAPFRFESDYSGWSMIFAGTPGSTNGWGTFWAGNDNPAYYYFGASNPNEYVFVGAGSLKASIDLDNGQSYFATSLRSPIFYDSDNTGYYLDPAGTSNLNALILAGSSYFRPQTWIQMDGSYGMYWPNTNGCHVEGNTLSTYGSLAIRGTRGGWKGIHFYEGGNVPHLMFDGSANGGIYYETGGRWASYYSYSNNCWGFGTTTTSSAYNIYVGTGIYSGGRVDGTIFYDSNNTAFYCDPTATSNFTGLTVANTITGSVSGNAATATNVAWTGITQATRTNYDLTFQPPNSGYAGFTFNTTGGVAGSAGYFLIRGTSDTDVYTAEGITLVADAGWLTLAQRTTASKGVRLMTGTTSTERLKITTAGDIQFVNGNSFTYNSNVVLHAGNYGGYSAFTSSLTSTVDARAPIFYDSNDTTYYLDPANTTLSLKTRSSIVINNASAPNNLAMLNIGYNGGGETRAIDIQGSWSGGENKSITFTHSSGSTNIVAQINAQHNGPGSKLRWGKLHHSGDSSTYTMELISESTTSAYLYVAGSVRTPIFYDSDNTAYYIDAASASILNTIRLTGKLTNNGSVSDDDGFGVYWDSGESTAYAIYREAGSWTNPFPDLRIAFHTGIKIGANAGYNGVRFYDDYGMGTQVMSVNNGSDGLGANNVYVNNSLQAGSSLRAPIFYDSNDTTYYVDPNSLSNIRHTIFHIGSNVVGATGIGVLFDGNYTSGQYRHRFRKYDDGNGLPLYVDYAHATANSFTAIARFGGGGSYNPFSVYGTADASGDFRAPIFYDSNDTGYYLDPRSASVLSGLKLNGIGNDAAGNTSDAILWINKPDNNDWGIRVTGNLEYLLKLEGATSHTYNIQGLANGSEFWRCGTDLLYHNSNIRAPIFYDSDNTGYYLNPAGNSQVVSIYANDWFRAQGNTGLYFQDKGYGITSAGAASNSYGNASTYGTGVNGWQGWGIGSRHCMMSTGGDNFGVHDNTRSWLYYWDGTYHRFQYGYLQSANSVRGPLFYDSDNTAYYLDPASTSNLNSLDIAGTLSSAAYNNLSNDYKDIYVYGDVNTYYVVLIQGEYLYSFGRYSVTRGYNWHGPDTWNTASHKGGLTLDWEWSGDTAWGGNDKSIRIIEFNETYSTMVAGLGYPVNGGVIIWLRGGGTNGALYRIRTPLGSNSTVIAYDGVSAANHSSSTTFTAADSAVFSTRANTSNVSSEILARYPVRGAATLNNEGNGVLDQGSTSQSKSGILSSSASLRAPIFYDSANTGYYVDPDSTSNLYVLSVASNATAAQYYTGGWFRNSTSGNGLYNEATGQHFYSDSANYWNVASSASAQGIRLRTGGHAGTVRGYFYADTNNDVGLLNQDGAWRLRVVGGDYSLADGSSMRAQLFYDSNDTAYYTNLAGRRDTNINGFTARTKMTLGLTAKYQLDRADYTGDGNYWTGVMGWGTTDFNTMITWGSGFIDSWSSPGNSPGTYTHFVGIQSLHYTNGDTDGTDNYGYQLVAGGGTTSPLYLRVNWGSAGSWRTMLDSSNYNSYSPTLTGTGASGSWGISVTGSSASCTGNAATVTNGMYLSGDQFISGAKYFTSNKGATSTVGANSTYSLEAYSNDAGAAGMSFHRGGYYAVNMGLDPDNIMRIGGWSAAANRWELDMSGNNWVASSFRAPIFYDSNNTAYYLDPASTSVLNRINLNTAATAYMQWRSAGQGTISGGFPFYHNASYGSINIEVSDNDTGGLVIDNEGVTVYGAGDNGQVFRVIDEDVYQATSNITASTTFYVNQLQNGGGGILGPFSISGTATAASFSGAGTGLTGTAASLSIGGNAANVTGTVAIANGGTGATTNANARTNLGATTVGSNLFTLTNPSAITFLRVNADNTVSALNASDFRNAIGAGGGGVTVETSVTQSLSGTTGCTIDVAAANVHILSLANATTISSFTYNNRNNNPSVNTLMIVLKYAGNASITWTNVIWSNNINPTLTQASGYADVFMLTSYKGGAGTPVWIGTVVAAGLVSTNL